MIPEVILMLISYKTIGRNIRAARKDKNLTQEQTAELMKISVLHYGRLERGERPASLEQLANVALVLNSSLSQLLSGCVEGERFGAPPSAQARTTSEQAAQVIDGCSIEAQELILSLIRTVAEHDRKNEFKI